MDEILLIGAGGHAGACIDVIETSDRFRVAGLVEKSGAKSRDYMGYPIIGFEDELPRLRHSFKYALVAFGHIRSAINREKIFESLMKLEFALPVIVSPRAYVSSHAKVDVGTIVMHGAIINANASIGKNCIVNSTALVEHDAVVNDHCHVSTGAIINGQATIGKGSFIGSGATLIESVSLGERCVIGANMLIKHDLQSNSVFKV